MWIPNEFIFNRESQILPEAFEFLFREFTTVTSKEKLFRGYRLLACDGSDLCIAHNPQDETTYFQSMRTQKALIESLWMLFYDLLSWSYVGGVIEPARRKMSKEHYVI